MIAAIDRYLALRRSVGFVLSNAQYLLRSFAAFAADRQQRHISTATVIDWAIEFSIRHKLAIIFVVASASLLGWWSILHSRLDALPELGDTQVIIFSRWDRSPDLVERQVTYPIVTAMLGAPHVKAVRAQTMFGDSYIFAVFEDGTIDWSPESPPAFN